MLIDAYRIQAVIGWQSKDHTAFDHSGFTIFLNKAWRKGLLPLQVTGNRKLEHCRTHAKKRKSSPTIHEWPDWQDKCQRYHSSHMALQMFIVAGLVIGRNNLKAQSAPNLVNVINAAILSLESDHHRVVNCGLPRGFFEWLRGRQSNAGVGRAGANNSTSRCINQAKTK
jgi:hypothetical protein